MQDYLVGEIGLTIKLTGNQKISNGEENNLDEDKCMEEQRR